MNYILTISTLLFAALWLKERIQRGTANKLGVIWKQRWSDEREAKKAMSAQLALLARRIERMTIKDFETNAPLFVLPADRNPQPQLSTLRPN